MKRVIKLNLITLCLINTLSVSIVDAKAEETLDQIDVVEKMSLTIKNLLRKQKRKVPESIFLKKPRLSIKSFEVSLVHLLNKIKALA